MNEIHALAVSIYNLKLKFSPFGSVSSDAVHHREKFNRDSLNDCGEISLAI